MSNNNDDLEILAKAKPYIRSCVALLLRLRYPLMTLDTCYSEADRLLNQLTRDAKESES